MMALDPNLDRSVTSPDGQIFHLVFIVPSAPLFGFLFAAYRRDD